MVHVCIPFGVILAYMRWQVEIIFGAKFHMITLFSLRFDCYVIVDLVHLIYFQRVHGPN